LSKPSAVKSFVGGKCPQCREGKIFRHPVYDLKRFRQSHDRCPVCNVKFESEPGFFWGAMYFSYALNVGMAIVTGIIFFSIYEDPPLFWMVATVLLFSVGLSPFTFRISRLFMMYLASPYRKYKGVPEQKPKDNLEQFEDQAADSSSV
jgi:uncharacterized protein (DUF983 family)